MKFLVQLLFSISTRQNRSLDNDEPTARHFALNLSGPKHTDHASPTGIRCRKESGVESPVLSVSRTRAMFEEISKSQEDLVAPVSKSRSS